MSTLLRLGIALASVAVGLGLGIALGSLISPGPMKDEKELEEEIARSRESFLGSVRPELRHRFLGSICPERN